MNSRFLKRKTYWRPREPDDEYDCESSLLLSQERNDSDGDDTTIRRTFPLRPKRPMLHYMEHTLQAGETLSTLALRYNCSIAQIKQANNIIRENEIFALRSVRIPVPVFSSLRDDVPGVHLFPLNSKKTLAPESQEENATILSLLGSDSEWKEDTGATLSDEELHNPLLTPIPVAHVPLVDLSETDPPDLNLAEHRNQRIEPNGIFNCSGADGGISWVALVLCTLVLGFVGPLIYIFFLYEHEQERKMHNQTSI